MQRKTSVALATLIVSGIAVVYLLRRPQQRDADKMPTASTNTEGATNDAVSAGHGPAAAGAHAPTASAVIEGEVQFTGTPPAPGRLHREADPYCARREMIDATVLTANGRLANVWVRVVNGAPDAPPQATTVEIDQRDCMYAPRVTTAVVGQKIVARNTDPILHNVHTYLGNSTLFNKGMPNEKAAPLEYTTAQPGLIKFKCDVHPWMRAYVGVSRNAFQAVTGSDGAFRISNLPPGRYTLEAWHEKFGTRAVEVTAPGRVVFSYDGTTR